MRDVGSGPFDGALYAFRARPADRIEIVVDVLMALVLLSSDRVSSGAAQPPRLAAHLGAGPIVPMNRDEIHAQLKNSVVECLKKRPWHCA